MEFANPAMTADPADPPASPQPLPLTGRERWLFRLLLATGLVTMAALPFAFVPTSVLANLHQLTGLGDWPRDRVTEYLARTASFLYFALGVVVTGLSTDIRRYRPLIGWLAWLAIGTGLALPTIDLMVGMPWYWVWLEGPPAVPWGLLVLWLLRPDDRTC